MNIPPYGDTFKKALLQFANLKVKAQNTPNMTVYVYLVDSGIIHQLVLLILNLLVEVLGRLVFQLHQIKNGL